MPILGTVASSILSYLNPSSGYFSIATGAGDNSSPSVNFSNIPQTYKHLQIIATTKNTVGTSDWDALIMRFNNDSGASSYITATYFYYVSANVAQYGVTNPYDRMVPSYLPMNGSSIGSANVGCAVITIMDYANPNKFKSVLGKGGTNWGNGTGANLWSGSVWKSTNPVTSIQIGAQAGNFANGAVVGLYGFN